MALALLLGAAGPARGQNDGGVSLRVQLAADSAPSGSRDPIVTTTNLLADTPWLTTLRQGLPVRLQYRLERWRSREGWFDVQDRALEWTVVVRHEPLLDQFSVVRLLPNQIRQNTYATPGALAAALAVPYRYLIAPRTEGRYYYRATLDVATLSDSDLDQLERVLKGDLDPRNRDAGSLAQRVRRLVLELAGLPATNLSARSEAFEVRSEK
jgi:hypothetical protein